MAIAFVQQKSTVNGTSQTPAAAFTSNTTTGNCIMVAVLMGVANTVSSIAISSGSASFVKGIAVPNGNFPCEIWYALNITGGTTPTVTVTESAVDTVGSLIAIYEFSGVATSSAADGTGASGTGTSASPALGSNLVTTNANDVLFSGCNVSFSTTAGPASWTTESTFFASAYRIVSSTGSYPATYTQTASGSYTVAAFALKAAGAGTPVNATVAIAAHATVTPLVQVIKDAVFFCAAHATVTCRSDLGIFGHAILQGKATSSSFTPRLLRNGTVNLAGSSVFTPNSTVVKNVTVPITGTASHTVFNGRIQLQTWNATVHIFAFAANNIPIDQFFGRASLRALVTIPQAQVTFNGRATLTPQAQVIRNVQNLFQGRASLSMSGLVTGGPGSLNATVVIQGSAAGSFAAQLIQDAQVFIQAGNQTFTITEAKIAILAKARATFSPRVTHNSTVAISGVATSSLFNAFVQGSGVINAAVLFKGTATLRASVPTVPIFASCVILGTATLTPGSSVIISNNAVVQIASRATAPFSAMVVGGTFQNAVVSIAGHLRFTPLCRRLVQSSVTLAGLASLRLFPGDIIRSGVVIHGFARLTAAVAKNPLQWSSEKTLQYKIWQYNTESMVRVLGSSWTATSVGLSFQAVSMEVVSTEAGWGS